MTSRIMRSPTPARTPDSAPGMGVSDAPSLVVGEFEVHELVYARVTGPSRR
jgi:hypothetical protein